MKLNNLKLLIIVFGFFNRLFSFVNLEQAREYSLYYPEFPKFDSKVEEGDFSTFYNSLVQSRWKKFLIKLGFENRPIWNYSDFTSILKRVTQICSNRLKNNTDKDFYNLLEVDENSQIILWGDLEGGFHSFVRDLTYLLDRNIIDNQFKLIVPDTYLVFNGNVIGRGPYPIETLTLVLKLIEVNPDKIFYIKGHQEEIHVWPEMSLAKQIKILTSDITYIDINCFFNTLPIGLLVNLKNDVKDIIKISYFGLDKITDYVDDLFVIDSKAQSRGNLNSYLAKAYIQGQLTYNFHDIHLTNKVPNFSCAEGLYRLANINNTIVWSTKSSPIQFYRMNYKFYYDSFVTLDFGSSIKDTSISLYFSSESNNFELSAIYNLINGELLSKGQSALEQLPYYSKNFHLLDKQQLINRLNFIDKKVNFVQDQLNYLESKLEANLKNIEVKNKVIKDLNFDNSFIDKLLNQNFENQEDIYSSVMALIDNFDVAVTRLEHIEQLIGANNLILKENLKNIVHIEQPKGKIILGSSAALTRTAKGVGVPICQGLSLSISDLNHLGGINGNFIDLVFLDDKYIPYLFEKNIRDIFYKYETNLLLFPEGSTNILHVLNFINDNNMFIFFSKSGSSFLRDTKLKNVINFRASFIDEGKVLVDHVLKHHSNANFLFFYQDDAFGLDVLQGAKSILDKNSIKNWTEVLYRTGTSNLKEAAIKIKQANPDTIGLFVLGPTAVEIIRELGVEFLANKTVFGVSAIADDVTRNVLKNMGVNLLLSQLVPCPESSDLEIVKEYRKKLSYYGYEPNAFSLEAYIAASIFFDQVSKIDLPITGEKIMNQMEKLKNYNFKGLKLNFNLSTRSLNNSIWLRNIDGKCIEKNIEDLEEYKEVAIFNR